MTKSNSSYFFICILLCACVQKKSESLKASANTVTTKPNLIDTTPFVILQIDSTFSWLSKKVTPAVLTYSDLEVIDKLINDCIKNHNSKRDSTNSESEFIDLKKYKRQYVPFINSEGEKQVYVNCFCISEWDYDSWKKTLVEVEDGGSCFFNLMILLKKMRYQQFKTNGYA